MRAMYAAIAVVGVGCGEAPPPPAATVAPAAPAVEALAATVASPAASAPQLTPTDSDAGPAALAKCAATRSADLAQCQWTLSPRGTCVCNGCLTDADCATHPGGTCATLPAPKAYFPSAKACLYPGQDCYAGQACAKRGEACNHDGMGHATACGRQGDVGPR